MAISIAMVVDYDGKGLDKAIRQFNQLETTGQKANFVLKKAALASTAAFAGLAAGIGFATKAAMEDAQAQTQLALALKNTTGATNAQIASSEKYISTLSRATGVADDQLRPALAALVRGTKDVEVAQRGLNLAVDISTATGMDLVTVSDALAKAYQGNMRGLRALSPEMAALIKEGASLDQVMQVLAGTFGGAAAANAETAAGKMQIFRNSMNEATESLGAAFLPVLEAILPKVQAFADWAGENTGTLVKLTYAIGGTTAAVIALNFAMNLNPVVALATGFVAITAAIWKAGTAFRNAIGTTQLMNWYFDGLMDRLRTLGRIAAPIASGLAKAFSKAADAIRSSINMLIKGINVLIRGMNAIPGVNIPLIPELTNFQEGGFGFFGENRGDMPGASTFPGMSGGGPTGAVGGALGGSSGSSAAGTIGAAVNFGPQAGPTLGQGMGIGTGWDLNAIPIFDTPEMQAINVTINSTLADASLPDKIVQALRDYNQTTGPLRVQVA
jgi:hypothetical protein